MGGWQGIHTFRGTQAMTEIARNSEQISGPALQGQKLKMIDDKLGLAFGDKLKSDLTGASSESPNAILSQIYDLLSNAKITNVGILRM